MTKKQAAMKTLGKSSITEPISSKKASLISDTKKLWSMEFMAERGFKLTKASPAFASTVTALGWERFVEHRKSFVVSLVREFYAGIPEHINRKPQTYFVVRVEIVNFDARTINEWFHLGYHERAFEKKVNSWGKGEMKEVRNRDCVEKSGLEKFGQKYKLKKTFLHDKANLWFNFIKHSLLPTSHTTNVEKEIFILLDSIMSGESIDMMRHISREIGLCRDKR